MREFSGNLGLATLVLLGLRGAPHFVPFCGLPSHFRGGLGQIYFSARLIDRVQTRCYYFDVCTLVSKKEEEQVTTHLGSVYVALYC